MTCLPNTTARVDVSDQIRRAQGFPAVAITFSLVTNNSVQNSGQPSFILAKKLSHYFFYFYE